MESREYLEGSPSKILRKLAIPAGTGLVFNTFFNITDLLYASRYSLNALSGLTLASSIFFMLISISVGLSFGLSVLMSNARGEKREGDVKTLFLNSLFIAIIFSLLVLIFILPFLNKMLLLFTGDKQDGILEAEQYLKFILAGFFFFIFNNILNSVLASSGDTKTYRNFLGIGFVLNIILNYFFMYGIAGFEGLGVAGLALSTVLIQVFGSAFLLYKVIKTKQLKDKSKFSFIQFQTLGKIIVYGLPAFINLMTLSLFQVFIQYFLFKDELSGQAIAGYGAGLRIEQIVLLPFLGFSTAIILATSRSFGAKRFSQIKDFIKAGLSDSFLLMIIIFIPVVLFRSEIALFFTNDKVASEITAKYIIYSFIGFYFNFISLVLANVLHSLKKPVLSAIIYFLNNLVLPVIIVFVFIALKYSDIVHLFISFALGKVIIGLVSLISLNFVFKKLDRLEDDA